MNYLAEILTFNNWIKYNFSINKSDVCLWHFLMSMANRFMWQKFNLPISIIVSESKLTKNEFYKSRNKLKQFGLIEFKELGGNRATVYKVNSIVSLYGKQIGTQNGNQMMTQMMTQTVTQNVNILKTKNLKLKNKKEKDKKKKSPTPAYGEFSNVFLCDDEFLKLQKKLGEEKALSYIERLSGYIASSGKKYKSHYATLLNWALRDQNKAPGGENFAQNKKLCTEYPEE